VSLPDPSCLVPDEASEFVHQNFRTTIRGSAVVIACVACVYAVALWRLGDAHWWHHALIALLAAALQPCFGPRAAYPAFLAALLLLIGTCTVSIGHLALRYGPAALFHAMLLAYTPVLVTSGRLTLWAKGCWWAGPACSRSGWMPRAPRAGRSWPPARRRSCRRQRPSSSCGTSTCWRWGWRRPCWSTTSSRWCGASTGPWPAWPCATR
jgi:hypothetical protein